MNRAEHYREAEQLLERADRPDNHPEASQHYLRMAQVHATLAASPNEVYTAVLDAQAEVALQEQEQKWVKDWPGKTP